MKNKQKKPAPWSIREPASLRLPSQHNRASALTTEAGHSAVNELKLLQRELRMQADPMSDYCFVRRIVIEPSQTRVYPLEVPLLWMGRHIVNRRIEYGLNTMLCVVYVYEPAKEMYSILSLTRNLLSVTRVLDVDVAPFFESDAFKTMSHRLAFPSYPFLERVPVSQHVVDLPPSGDDERDIALHPLLVKTFCDW